MCRDPSIAELLRRPVVIAAVQELGVSTLGLEDVLGALRRFGAVTVAVGEGRFTCELVVPEEDPERGHGTTVFHAALACWSSALEATGRYSQVGIAQLERFLAAADEAAGF